MAADSTWVNDLILFIEGHSGVLPLPLGPLNIQVALFYGEGGDALVMSGVELSQVLPKEPNRKYSLNSLKKKKNHCSSFTATSIHCKIHKFNQKHKKQQNNCEISLVYLNLNIASLFLLNNLHLII